MADGRDRGMNRRRFIQSTGTTLATALAAQTLQAEQDWRATTPRQPALIRQENQREGARDWQLTRIHIESQSGYRSPRVEGYCSRQSVRAGERLDLMVSTRPAARPGQAHPIDLCFTAVYRTAPRPELHKEAPHNSHRSFSGLSIRIP